MYSNSFICNKSEHCCQLLSEDKNKRPVANVSLFLLKKGIRIIDILDPVSFHN